MSYETILVEKEETFMVITLNRPPLNVVNQQMLEELMNILDKTEDDSTVRSIILTGKGKHFCGGADVRVKDNFSAQSQEPFHELGRRMVDRIELYPKPIIAAVKGKCFYGGTGLAWPCDIRISGESGKFRAGDAYLGIVSSWGVGLVRTAHWIGRNRALDIMILGEIFDGKRAVEIGIMSKVVPDNQLMEEAKAAARTIAQAAPIALRSLKEGVAMSIKGTYAEAKAKEVELVRKVYQTEDSQEGLAALLEDRKPNFKGQ